MAIVHNIPCLAAIIIYLFFFFSVEEGYILRQNATFHYNNILTNTRVDSSVLAITIYLNFSFYPIPESLTSELLDDNSPFTSYFRFSNGNTTEVIFYNGSESDPDDTCDQLRIVRRVVTLREVPAGEYRAQLVATLRGRTEIGAALQEYTSNSTVIIRVTKSKYAN